MLSFEGPILFGLFVGIVISSPHECAAGGLEATATYAVGWQPQSQRLD